MKRFFLVTIIVFLSPSSVYSYDFSHSTKINIGTSSGDHTSNHDYSSERSCGRGGNDYSYSPHETSYRGAGQHNAGSYKISVKGPLDPLYVSV